MSDDFEQGHVPAEDMGVMYTLVRSDGIGRVYDCSECVREERIITGVQVPPGKPMHTALYEHSAQHGFSAFTLPQGQIDRMLQFKRVTALRNEANQHDYECSWCRLVLTQNELESHASGKHKTEDFWIDDTPSSDARSWKNPAAEFVQGFYRDNSFPAKLPDTGPRVNVHGLSFKPPKEPVAVQNEAPWVFTALGPLFDYLRGQMPAGFDGKVTEEDGPLARTYRLFGKDGTPVAWLGGEFEISLERGPMKDRI